MKAYLFILDFGDVAQRLALCDTIERVTGLAVNLGSTGNPIVTCEVDKVGDLFVTLANDPATDWIEYTVQFG